MNEPKPKRWNIDTHLPDHPHRWRTGQNVIVVGDPFAPERSDGVVAWMWITMAKTTHGYRIETAHPDRLADFLARWNDLTGETGDFRGARGPDATRAAHPSGRGQLFAAYLEAMVATEPGGVPPEGAVWPTFDWAGGPRWWWPWLWNVEITANGETVYPEPKERRSP